ncbi:hypothetical protein E2562_035611 [Oryza meyeriana var. granulata]|uniref:Uncharacterized protein n=1 Tax=Oryza meyeriana var. granulata TaxID=110450 RepID=A0A6G1ESU5_9ORYZ|nr:hypothetical protein E2562_035611 [Oryza meyeriana var. granulata]
MEPMEMDAMETLDSTAAFLEGCWCLARPSGNSKDEWKAAARVANIANLPSQNKYHRSMISQPM